MGPQQPDELLRALIQQSRALDVRLTLFVADLTGSFGFLDEADLADARSGRLEIITLAGAVPRRWSPAVDYLPLSLWDVDRALSDGRLTVDVVVAVVVPGPEPRTVAFGDMVGFTPSALTHASAVGFELRPGRSFPGCYSVPLEQADTVVTTGNVPALPTRPPARLDAIQDSIGRQVAALIPDTATLQLGLGAVPEAVCAHLGGRRDLGLHSGVLSSSLRSLIRSGAVNGACKSVEIGRHVATGVLDADDDGPGWGEDVELQPISLTHAPDRLLRHDRLWAVNSAFEVDLAGQPNAEYAGGARVASGGGQADFVRAAHVSRGGAAVIALPARTRTGRSRIVARLAPAIMATSPGSDIDIVVTEHGVAHLTARTAAERAHALIAIAHPDDREQLVRELADER
jgi:4-hydroxybutyrate CoA-transferase